MKVGLHPAEKINIKKQAEFGMISRLFFHYTVYQSRFNCFFIRYSERM